MKHRATKQRRICQNCPTKRPSSTEGFLEVDLSGLLKFDLVFITHSHYFFPNLKDLVSKAIAICREGSGKVEVISDQSHLYLVLAEIVWLYQAIC